MKTQKGFSLIELMVVVVIIGILATVAYPSYRGYVLRGDRADALKNFQALGNAQERYKLNNQEYTKTLTDLGVTLNAAGKYETTYYEIEAEDCEDSSGVNIDISLCVQLKATRKDLDPKEGYIIWNTMGELIHETAGSLR